MGGLGGGGGSRLFDVAVNVESPQRRGRVGVEFWPLSLNSTSGAVSRDHIQCLCL